MSERKVVDARDSFCPGPLMELIANIRLIDVGSELELLSKDTGSAEEVPAWLAKVGHQHISTEKRGDHWSIVVKRLK